MEMGGKGRAIVEPQGYCTNRGHKMRGMATEDGYGVSQ
jgi:hypothetical protein